MTKEEYLEVCKLPEIPMNRWFEYYRERGGIVEDRDEFERIFATAIANEFIVGTESNPKKITLQSAINNFYSYYNKKFDINEYKGNTPEGGSSFIFI